MTLLPSAPDWHQELAELKKEYRLQTVTLELGGRRLKLIKAADLNELLDRVSDADLIPFWAELWPAALGLAHFIWEHPAKFQGRILELGAGVGLAGIAAKLLGAEVVQSDFIPDALRFTRVNCQRNQLPAGEQLLADWRGFPALQKKFDRIIGADLLYDPQVHSQLLQVLTANLRPRGQVWLADPGRDQAGRFWELAQRAGWQRQQLRLDLNYEAKAYRIELHRLQPPGNRPPDPAF